MKEEVKRTWLEALRSGEYQQGVMHLFKDGKFCCLGILTDLYFKSEEGHTEFGYEWHKCPAGYGKTVGEIGALPDKVVRWSGLEDCNPVLKVGNGNVYRASNLNDSGYSFEAIADMIEEAL